MPDPDALSARDAARREAAAQAILAEELSYTLDSHHEAEQAAHRCVEIVEAALLADRQADADLSALALDRPDRIDRAVDAFLMCRLSEHDVPDDAESSPRAWDDWLRGTIRTIAHVLAGVPMDDVDLPEQLEHPPTALQWAARERAIVRAYQRATDEAMLLDREVAEALQRMRVAREMLDQALHLVEHDLTRSRSWDEAVAALRGAGYALQYPDEHGFEEFRLSQHGADARMLYLGARKLAARAYDEAHVPQPDEILRRALPQPTGDAYEPGDEERAAAAVHALAAHALLRLPDLPAAETLLQEAGNFRDALTAALSAMSAQRDDAGLPIAVSPWLLVVPNVVGQEGIAGEVDALFAGLPVPSPPIAAIADLPDDAWYLLADPRRVPFDRDPRGLVRVLAPVMLPPKAVVE